MKDSIVMNANGKLLIRVCNYEKKKYGQEKNILKFLKVVKYKGLWKDSLGFFLN